MHLAGEDGERSFYSSRCCKAGQCLDGEGSFSMPKDFVAQRSSSEAIECFDPTAPLKVWGGRVEEVVPNAPTSRCSSLDPAWQC